MTELRSIETDVLIDMLSAHTAEYLKLMDDAGKETEYAKCILTIRAIQTEIEMRKRTEIKSNTSDPATIF